MLCVVLGRVNTFMDNVGVLAKYLDSLRPSLWWKVSGGVIFSNCCSCCLPSPLPVPLIGQYQQPSAWRPVPAPLLRKSETCFTFYQLSTLSSLDILFFRDTTGILVCFKPATWERVKMKLVGLSEGRETGKYFRYCICVSRFRRPLSSTYGTSYLPTMEGTRTRCEVVLQIKMLLMIVCFKSLEGGVWPEGCKKAKRIQVLSIYLYFKRRCGGSFLFNNCISIRKQY